jgi:hypothetical protein
MRNGFECLRILAGERAGSGSAGYPALMMAALAAAAGRDAVGCAPSMPAVPRAAGTARAGADGPAVAGEAAELAGALASRLSQAAGQSGLPGDRAASRQAALDATAICALLGE